MADYQGRAQDMRDGNGIAAAETTPASGPRHVGEWLRLQREALGYGLPDLAAGLRIRLNYLEAIEEGRWGDLPGQAYTVGFLRTYAQTVGLDPGTILLRFKQETAGAGQEQELYFPEPVNESRVPGGAVLLIAALLGVLVYGGWYALSASDRSVGDFVPELPERLSSLIFGEQLPTPPPPEPTTTMLDPGQVEALVGDSGPTAPEIGASSSIPGGAPLPPSSTAGAIADAGMPATDTSPVPALAGGEEDSEVPQLPDLGQSAPPAPAAEPATPESEPMVTVDAAPAGTAPPKPAIVTDVPPSGRVYGVAEGNVRVTIRALEDSWIEVKDGKGTLWASRVLRRGDLFRAPDVPGLLLNTGNAGGLLVTLDGRDVAPLGAKSQVMRGVPLTPDALTGR